MKHFLILFICLPTFTFAQEIINKEEPDNRCEILMKFSAIVMEDRQNNISLIDEFEKRRVDMNPHQPIYSIVTTIIDSAYKIPIQSSEEYKVKIKNKFSEKVYFECQNIMSDKK